MIWFILAIAIAVTVLGICRYTYRTCFYSPRNRKEDPYKVLEGEQYQAVSERIINNTRLMDNSPCQWVSITSFDGLKLYGRYYHNADNAPLMIMFHGYRSMALRDCAGGHRLGKQLAFNLLVADQRAHARSRGTTISFGINERKDCQCWLDYAVERFGAETPIILSGLSMGATTILMAAGEELPENVAGIVADCPYSSPPAIIRKVSRDWGYPDKLVYPFIWLGARIFGKFNLTEASAVIGAKNATVPILLIHGEDDRFVPCDMSREIAKAGGANVRLETFPEAGHGLCYISDPWRYERITVEFLRSLPAIAPFLKYNPFAQKYV